MACVKLRAVLGRLLVACSLVTLPFFGMRSVLASTADRLGTSLGEWAALEANWLKPVLVAAPPVAPASPPPIYEPEPTPIAPEEAPALQAPSGSAKKSKKTPRKPATSGAPAPARGVFVSAANVLRLAQARAVPHAVFVPASGARPAGLQLAGVGGLGIGMRDGDILTRVSGAPVSSVGEVVARVIAARAQRAARIGGEFWRNGEVYNLIVEQPYVAETAP
ncbi:MAG TPA: hypothetical protein VFQ61_21305 [Polyangiaceae bacterium]|nr:hypothetical protein [Polyangiaceae bacterium]